MATRPPVSTQGSEAGDAPPVRLLVIDNHDSYTYNLVHLVSRLTGTEPDVVAVDRFRVEMGEQYDAIIISPGPGHPAREAAFEECLRLMKSRTRPLLGVCLGHQGLVVAHGGRVERVDPSHGVIEAMRHDGTGLFLGVEQGAGVVRYHSLAAVEVPPALEVTATTAEGVVMAVAHRELPHYGVQFHPESILTLDGQRIIANFLRLSGIPLMTADETGASIIPPTMPEPPAATSRMEGILAYSHWLEPAWVARQLLRGRRRAFWLDSVERREWTGRYSMLGYLSDDERSVVVGGPQYATLGVQSVPRASFLAHMTMLADEIPAQPDALPSVGGWVGVAGYETQEVLASDETGSPADGFFMKTSRVVVFDHDTKTVFYRADSSEQASQLRDALDAIAADGIAREADLASNAIVAESVAPWATYVSAFERIDDALRAGDTYEAVLTFPLDFTLEGDPLDQYLALRHRSPAPYAAYLRHDDEVVLSASPERMLSVDATRRAEIRRIKGTLPRSPDSQSDALARWVLATDDKFRRENLMITDLIRNDLGRVARSASVIVNQLMAVESYRGVHQLVSVVSATLRDGVSAMECLRAVFPAGSMTGTPKRRTMELIRDIEPVERGVYAGALGWFDSARADFSVVIRTLHGRRGRYRLNVGGGIIIGSTPEDEFAEALDKARSVAPAPLRPESAHSPG